MSDELETTGNAADQELEVLKARADTLGITYKSNIGLETLRERVRQKMEGETDEGYGGAPSGSTKKETEQQVRERVTAEAMALIRVRIANMNPAKADLEGEFITVANKFVGTVTKLIPFGKATNNGYHIPKILYDDLISRQFQQVTLKKNNRGLEEVQTNLVQEYNIQILPPMTAEELQELALKQQAAERLGG